MGRGGTAGAARIVRGQAAPRADRPRRRVAPPRYGTTGSAPPSSDKGKSFVHDPKVSGVTEVKAQLKLRFKNYGGQRMVVVRSMQLTQKPKTSTFKQMDGVIRTRKDNGENTSYTHKCGELDKAVPMMIGVSKAVLESVVFCARPAPDLDGRFPGRGFWCRRRTRGEDETGVCPQATRRSRAGRSRRAPC